MIDLHVGILREFGERSARRFVEFVAFDGVSLNLEPENLRAAYRAKHDAVGLCRSCCRDAKPGRKYCVVHLARANARAVRSQARRVGP